MHFTRALALLSLSTFASAQSLDEVTEVTDCHPHGATQYCTAGDAELPVVSNIDVDTAPDSYTDCHLDGEELHCTGDGYAIILAAEGSSHTDTSSEEHSGTTEHSSEDATEDSGTTAATESISCHSHAGVEHCVDAEGTTVDQGCAAPDYDYNVRLRIGLLFVMLATSSIGVFVPIFTERFSSIKQDSILFIGLRQLGTGIIISTALVHLFTHAEIYFANECLGELDYESTVAAIVMAGIFVTFFIEFIARRLGGGRGHGHGEAVAASPVRSDHKGPPSDAGLAAIEGPSARTLIINTAVIEAGIIFHSILLGVVLVVANDSGFITLFIVIIFHQMFEGIALGTRIAIMPGGFIRKLVLGAAFAITTPIGMAIGIGVLSEFNGNDPSTIIAIGTLNAFSAGILLWIGVTEMWYKEWFYGPLARAGPVKTVVGFLGLITGLVLMSLIGKWA